MNEEDWSSIEQVPVYTEKELANEFDALSTTLNGTSVDWNKRLKALKRLQGLILGGAFHLGNFPTLLCKVVYHINTQLQDLRSAISKEACSVVCLAAKKGGESLDAFCDKIITKECLLKLVNNANKILSEPGHMCIVTLLEEVKCHRVVPKIIEELNSKNAALRQKIAEYLNIIVNSYDQNIIEKYQSLLEGAITTAISDANKDVRQITRKTFHAYSELFPSRADKMLSNFDLSIQKALIDDGLVDSNFSPQKKSVGGLTPPPTKPTQRPASAASGKASNKKAESGQAEMQKTYSTAYTFDSSEKVQSAGIPKKTVKEPTSAKAMSKSTMIGDKPATQARTSELSTSRFSSTVNKSLKEGNSEKVKTANSSPRINPNKSFHGGQTDLDQKTDSRGGRSHTPKKLLTATSQRMSPRAPSAKDLGSKQMHHSMAANEISLIKKNVTDFYQTIKDEDLKFLLEKTNDENWATRSNSFEKVNEFIAELKPDEEIGNPLMNQLITAHIQHINDNHYKVVIACQDSFSRLLTVYSSRVLSYMDRIIPLLFMNLTDGKEKVSASTNFVVNLINKIYLGDELFPHFLRSLDHSNKPAYKISLLEFMNVLIKGCKKHFTSPQATKSCLIKLTTLMNDFNTQKKMLLPCLGMILYLRELDPETTISTLVNLKEPIFTNILNIASEYAPDLEEEIADIKGVARDQSKSLGRKSPQMKKAKSKPNESMMDSFNKANLSYINETKGPKTMTENDVNMSMISQGNNEKKKNESLTRLSKESKHTSSNPCLSNFNSTKQKIISADNGYQVQVSTYKEQSSMWEEGQSLRVMQFDFDDDEHQNLKQGLSFANNKSVPKAKEDKIDISTLDGVQRVIEQYPKNKSIVEDKLASILAALLKFPLEQNMTPYERSLELFRKILNFPLNFRPFTRELVSGLISLYHLPQKAFSQIDGLLKTVLAFGSSEDCLDSMLDSLEKEDHPIIQIVIKNITHILMRDQDIDVTHYLSSLFEKYYELVNHNNPDVRKNVVFSIVDLHSVYSQQIENYLQEFSPSHQKLIDIYIQKRAEKQNGKV